MRPHWSLPHGIPHGEPWAGHTLQELNSTLAWTVHVHTEAHFLKAATTKALGCAEQSVLMLFRVNVS